MAIKTDVKRGAGHPWDGRKGFDLMMIDADTQEEMDAAVRKAEAKFWQPWLIGFCESTGKPGGVMYKPSGITQPWEDGPKTPHPGCNIEVEPALNAG